MPVTIITAITGAAGGMLAGALLADALEIDVLWKRWERDHKKYQQKTSIVHNLQSIKKLYYARLLVSYLKLLN